MSLIFLYRPCEHGELEVRLSSQLRQGIEQSLTKLEDSSFTPKGDNEVEVEVRRDRHRTRARGQEDPRSLR